MSEKPSDRPNRGGRPRTVCSEGEQGSRVAVYLPPSYHDRLVKLSLERDQSVSSIVRNLLILRLQ